MSTINDQSGSSKFLKPPLALDAGSISDSEEASKVQRSLGGGGFISRLSFRNKKRDRPPQQPLASPPPLPKLGLTAKYIRCSIHFHLLWELYRYLEK